MNPININTDPKINSGYKVPDDYFLNFENRLMSIINDEKEKTNVISFWKKKNIILYAIATTIIISIFTNIYFNQIDNYTINSTQEYLTYADDLTTEELVDYLTIEDLKDLEKEVIPIDHQTPIFLNEYTN
ncbi:hypothetical protein [Flavobacterium covae]|uniref:hypothetical protein n=2 Tax=Flavobacterium covae TaxID=2906076 RepID=UPI000745DA7E|nr:hypothetical protein [Flavobacterium covae]AMA48840.1 hypothetical protein AWN65_04865 [Flavobacterium covae]AND65027.1 hypothetical protein AX766_11845 [Flavobacterium covae]MCJ1807919.1 hypothetical protein [Flavobacterium covae]